MCIGLVGRSVRSQVIPLTNCGVCIHGSEEAIITLFISFNMLRNVM